MDFYTAERWALDRHRDMTRAAELHARLRPEAAPLCRSLAAGLRSLADRIDRPPAIEQEPFIRRLPS